MWRTSAATNDSWTEWPPKGFSLRRGSAGGGGEARNPPLPVADIGGCSANEATSFASVSAAKRLCRIVRVVGYEVAVSKVFIKDNATEADSAPHPAHYIRHLLLKEKAFIVVRYARNLAVLSNYRQSPRLVSAPNGTPVARRCNRHGVARATPSLKTAAFPSTTQVLCYFLHRRK